MTSAFISFTVCHDATATQSTDVKDANVSLPVLLLQNPLLPLSQVDVEH